MLISFDRIKHKKGQGIVEYALLLAFVVGIAMMLNGANLGGAVKGVFDDVAAVLGGKENSGNTYVTAFSKWHNTKRSDLFGDPDTAEERFQADLDALKIMAEIIAENVKTKADAAEFLNTNINKNELKYYEDNPYTNGIVLLSYFDETGEKDPNHTGNYINSTYYVGSDNQDRTIEWLTGKNSAASAYYTTPVENYQWYQKFQSTNRYFYSDAMLYDSGSAEKQIMANFKFDSDNNVTGVHVFVKQYKNNEVNNTYLAPTEGSGASSALEVWVNK